ncbi:147_t:CDS:2 [Racocetra fulgida]|uniref:147_t:CDS:1 n=1 Tax=Racocetra fulgida TaxID=60492 RepID=A0A9N8Z6L4_9GLOM|nr:147_t:CDS:2 [Racocetra fulgida]
MSQNPENTSDCNPNQVSEDANSYRDNQPSLPHTDSQISQASTITGMANYLETETEDNEDDEILKNNSTDIEDLKDLKDLFSGSSHRHHETSDNEENHEEDDSRRRRDEEEEEDSDENNRKHNKRESINRGYHNDENHYDNHIENQKLLLNGERQMFDYTNNNGMFNHDNHESVEDVDMINSGSLRYESDSESGRIKRKKLDEILGREDGETYMDDEAMTDNDQELEQENAFAPIPEDFCEVCFAMIHRTGTRQKHTKKNLKNEQSSNDALENGTQGVESVSQKTSNDGIELLYDEKVAIATREIKPEGKTRYQINSEIRQKERAVERLSHQYSSHKLPSDDIKTCLYSIGDNNSYLRANR